MKICVLSCSPKGDTSLTLQTIRFLEKFYPEDTFKTHMTFTASCPQDVIDDAADSDLIMILSSIFHLNVHAQMISMLDVLASGLKEKLGDDYKKLNFTYLTTSNFLYEIGAHRYVESWARTQKLTFRRALSLKDDSVLTEVGREELYRWFQYTKDTIELSRNGGIPKATEVRKVSIINDGLNQERTDLIKNLFQERNCEVKVFNLNDYKIRPCTACFACYSNRVCHIKDDFEGLVDEAGTGADLIVNVGTLKCGMLSQQYKFFTDRHVQFGRAGSGDEMVRMSLVETDDDIEEATISLLEYAQWEQATVGIGRDYNVGTYYIRKQDELIDPTPYVNDAILVMNNELYGQKNLFSENLNTRFAELAHLLQIMCPLDYQHYKKDGYYNGMPINTNVRYIDDMKGGNMACKMRLMPYNMAFAEVGDKPKLTTRRKYKNMSFVEHRRTGDAGKQEKGGLFKLFGKK